VCEWKRCREAVESCDKWAESTTQQVDLVFNIFFAVYFFIRVRTRTCCCRRAFTRCPSPKSKPLSYHMYQHLCSRLTALPAVPCQTADASTTVHWLPVQHRTDYKVSVLTYKTLNTSVPGYLSQRINGRVNARTLYARRLRHCSSNRSLAPTSRNVLFDAPRRLELTACV